MSLSGRREISMTKRGVWIGVACVLTAYVVVAVSPIRNAVGRRSPSTASWLSLPSLNFDHTYRDGQVLGFKMGMSTDEIAEVLVARYVGRGEVARDCDYSYVQNAKPIVASLDAASLRSRERLCADLDSSPVVFEFRNGVLVSARVAYIRMEAI